MHVCMLLEYPYPTDIRVEKEARALTDAGHEVTLLCLHDDEERSEETVGSILVRRLDVHEELRGPQGWKRGAYYLLTMVHPVWREEVSRLHRSRPIDVIHVHDLPLVKTAISVKDDLHLPVVADLHENWPEAVRQFRTADSFWRHWNDPRNLLERAANPISRLKRLERESVTGADRVIAIVEEGREHYLQDCGAVPEDVYVVSNCVDVDAFEPAEADASRSDDEFVFSYVGTFGGEHRGLEAVVESIPLLHDAVSNPRLMIVGKGGAYEEKIRALCTRIGVEDHVTFTGWVDFDRVPEYIAKSDVCLVPHRSNPHTETTVPHKLFQYMAMGKPVIVTDVSPLERIVTETLDFLAG